MTHFTQEVTKWFVRSRQWDWVRLLRRRFSSTRLSPGAAHKLFFRQKLQSLLSRQCYRAPERGWLGSLLISCPTTNNFHSCHCLPCNLYGPHTARAPLCSSWQSNQLFVACTWLDFLLNGESIEFFDNIKNIQIKLFLLFPHQNEMEIIFHFYSEFTAVPLKYFWKTSTPD